MIDPQRRRRGAVQKRRPTHVPYEVAERLVAERDRFAEELQRLRSENARIEEALRARSVELDSAEERAETAEAEAERLRRDLEKPVADDAVDALKRRVGQLTSDLERIRERTGREIEEARRAERARLLAGLGDVLDSVDRAIRSADEDNPWRAGLVAVRSQIHAFLRGEGATITGEVGRPLDPTIHEAVGVVEATGTPSGEIVRVERHGIVLENGKVARTAQVVLAR